MNDWNDYEGTFIYKTGNSYMSAYLEYIYDDKGICFHHTLVFIVMVLAHALLLKNTILQPWIFNEWSTMSWLI